MPAFPLSAMNYFINQYISLDPDYRLLLVPLVGKTISIEVLDPKITFFITFTDNSLNLHSQFEGACDCTIRGGAWALLQLSRQAQKNTAIPKEVEIIGDLHLAQALNNLSGALNIDWEEQLSKLVGDFAAYHVGNTLRKAWRWHQSCFNTLKLNVTEYLQEEIRHLPPRAEIQDFFDDIDTLKNDLERLTARLTRLQGDTNV